MWPLELGLGSHNPRFGVALRVVKPKPKPAPTSIDTEEGEEPITEKEIQSQLGNQILTYLMRVYNNMAHPHHPDPKDVRWWIDRCSTKRSNKLRETYTVCKGKPEYLGTKPVIASLR